MSASIPGRRKRRRSVARARVDHEHLGAPIFSEAVGDDTPRRTRPDHYVVVRRCHAVLARARSQGAARTKVEHVLSTVTRDRRAVRIRDARTRARISTREESRLPLETSGARSSARSPRAPWTTSARHPQGHGHIVLGNLTGSRRRDGDRRPPDAPRAASAVPPVSPRAARSPTARRIVDEATLLRSGRARRAGVVGERPPGLPGDPRPPSAPCAAGATNDVRVLERHARICDERERAPAGATRSAPSAPTSARAPRSAASTDQRAAPEAGREVLRTARAASSSSCPVHSARSRSPRGAVPGPLEGPEDIRRDVPPEPSAPSPPAAPGVPSLTPSELTRGQADGQSLLPPLPPSPPKAGSSWSADPARPRQSCNQKRLPPRRQSIDRGRSAPPRPQRPLLPYRRGEISLFEMKSALVES